jgi:hypothetical protein
MNRAIDAKWITQLPTENLRPLGGPSGWRRLIGKVYGHFSDEHTKRAAAKLDFNPNANKARIRISGRRRGPLLSVNQ